MIPRLILLLFLLVPFAAAQEPDPVLVALKQELGRTMGNLKQKPVAPYYLAYQLTDNYAIQLASAFGALVENTEQRTRLLDIDLRVGEFSLDNTHPLRGGTGEMYRMPHFGYVRMPLEKEPVALRTAVWRETDRVYKQAVEQLAEVKANVQVKNEPEDRSADFSAAPVERYTEPEAAFRFDRGAWEKKLRAFTAPFARHPEIIESRAQVIAEVETRRFVNSEGSEIRISSPFYRLLLSATVRAADGMEMPLHETFMAFRPEGLPGDDAVLAAVEKMIRNLLALRQAPLSEPYTGPAILTGRASAVFFHEIFGHRIEGHRQKSEDEAQTFTRQVNQPVLPAWMSAYSDPTLDRLAGMDLVGFYRYDDEGVKARRVTVVENGVLKTFLMSRSPIQGFAESNGHGRRQQGNAVTARQSNLVVEAGKKVSRAELKAKLLAAVKEAGKPYGLLFDDIEGGFTFTGRVIPNAFNVMPTLVYRVYPDGREELVRGLDLIGTPLIAFSKIVAADDQVGVFNGVCGAESGWVPVSAVSPGLLLSQIEVQRKEKSQERPPILPPPPATQ